MLPPQVKGQKENSLNRDDLFAKKVVEALNENLEVSDYVSNRLAQARQKAIQQLRVSKQEVSFFDSIKMKLKNKLNSQIMAGATAFASVCFAAFGFMVMDNANQLVFDQNVQEISAYSADSDDLEIDFDAIFDNSDEDQSV